MQKDPGNADHSEEMEIGEKRCIWGKAGCVCVGSLVFLGTGTRGPFHAPPQLEPRVRGEERKEGVRVLERDAEAQCVDGEARDRNGSTL